MSTLLPLKSKIVTLRPKSPWFTLEIQEQKVKRRRLERRWRKTRRLTIDREIASLEYSKILFRQVTPVTETQLEKFISKFACRSCDLDPIPAAVLKECLFDLIPVLTKIVNMSITDTVVPTSLKNAPLSPHLKKANLNPEEFSSFRPISNLNFQMH